MEIAIDFTKLTLREQKELCEAAEVRNLKEFMAGLEAMEPGALAAVCWILKRQSDPGFAIEAAYDLTMDDLTEMFGKKAPGGAESASLTPSSALSASSTGTRRTNSGASRPKRRAS